MISIYVFTTMVFFGLSMMIAGWIGWLCRGWRNTSLEPASHMTKLIDAVIELKPSPVVIQHAEPANQPSSQPQIVRHGDMHPLPASYISQTEPDLVEINSNDRKLDPNVRVMHAVDMNGA